MAELRTGPLDVDVERVQLRGDDGTMVEAIHARPDGMPDAGLVLHIDGVGMRPLFDELCRRLATQGFAVCAPDPFARLPFDVVSSPDRYARFGHVPDLDDDLQIADLEHAADYLVVHDDIANVGVMGFCMGGMQALKAAVTGRFDRAVSFYGSPEGVKGPNLRRPLDTASQVCPTLAIFAGLDASIDQSEVEALRSAWAARPDCEIVVYPEAEHGFIHDPERPAHRAADAADAWARALAFLEPIRR